MSTIDNDFVAKLLREKRAVEALLYHQTSNCHPYTCGNDSSHQPLFMLDGKLYCHDCDYVQEHIPSNALREWDEFLYLFYTGFERPKNDHNPTV